MELPFELLLVNFSSRMLWHYFLPWLLPSVILMGSALEAIILKIRRLWKNRTINKSTTNLVIVCLFLIYITFSILPISVLAYFLIGGNYWLKTDQKTIDYIQQNTKPNDYVLICGGEPEINFITQTTSPSRFIATAHVFTPSPFSQDMTQELLNGIQKNKPKYIIDITQEKVDVLGISGKYESWQSNFISNPTPKMQELLSYIRANYAPIKIIGGKKWVVYQIIK